MGSLIIDWNGTEVPEGLRELPPGRYVVETLDDAMLTPEEEQGLLKAIASLDRGEGIPLEDAISKAREAIARA